MLLLFLLLGLNYRLEWKDSQRELNLLKRVSSKWRKFGHLLGISAKELGEINKLCQNNAEKCLEKVVEKWLKVEVLNIYEKTWEGLHELLCDIKLFKVAKDLREALDSYSKLKEDQGSDSADYMTSSA